MTVPIKVLIALLVWFLYMLIGYKSCIESCCEASTTTTTVVEQPLEAPQRFPIDFSWNSAQAFTNDGFADYKQQVLAGMTTDNILEIVGLYAANEAAPEGYENMGLARAEQIRQLFASDVPEDRIRLRAREMEGRQEGKETYFESALMNWEEASKATAEEVEELEDRILIRFPTNSVEKEASAAIDEYLAKLAERMTTTGQRIRLTGHTDSDGSAAYNMELSRQRATQIRNLLVAKGVNAKQIDMQHKGAQSPIAPNTTEEGKRENRRVEIVLL